jgi:endogenous inhibitor of DNA gyrase (YacG/DUF329 family)
MPPTVNCPTCATPVIWSKAELYRPFCSERCRLIDLGEWATGSYAIPVSPDSVDHALETHLRDDL